MIPVRRQAQYASLLEIALAAAMVGDLCWHFAHSSLRERARRDAPMRLEPPAEELEGTRDMIRLAGGIDRIAGTLGASRAGRFPTSPCGGDLGRKNPSCPQVLNASQDPGGAPADADEANFQATGVLRDAPRAERANGRNGTTREVPSRRSWRELPPVELPHLRTSGPAREKAPPSAARGPAAPPHPGRFHRPPGKTAAPAVPENGAAERPEAARTRRGTTPHPNPTYLAMRTPRGEPPGAGRGEPRPGPKEAGRPQRAGGPELRALSGSDVRSGPFLRARRLLKDVSWDGARRGSPRGQSPPEKTAVSAARTTARAAGGGAQFPAARDGRRGGTGEPREKSLLREFIGKGALRPPPDDPVPPDFSKVRGRLPPPLPGGKRVRPVAPSPRDAERLIPPAEEPAFPSWRRENAHRAQEHWHASGDRFYLHGKDAWGVWSGRWSWMISDRGRWWVLADRQPLLRHEGHWWWRNQGVWFLLHDGQPWAFRWFPEWESAGLVHPGSDTRIIYSPDGNRALVTSPGGGASLYDIRSGKELKRWCEEELPKSLQRSAAEETEQEP